MRSRKIMVAAGLLAAALTGIVLAQVYDAGAELALVEKVNQARDAYKAAITDLYNFYLRSGDMSNASRAQKEMDAYDQAEHYNFATKPGVAGGPVEKPTAILKFNQTAADYYEDGVIIMDTLRTSQKKIALNRFDKILTTWPDSDKASPAAYQMGEIYSSMGFRDYDAAASYYKKAYDIDPATMLPALVKAGNCYVQLQRWDDARQMYNLAITSSRDPKAKQDATFMLQRLAQLGH